MARWRMARCLRLPFVYLQQNISGFPNETIIKYLPSWWVFRMDIYACGWYISRILVSSHNSCMQKTYYTDILQGYQRNRRYGNDMYVYHFIWLIIMMFFESQKIVLFHFCQWLGANFVIPLGATKASLGATETSPTWDDPWRVRQWRFPD